MEMGLVGCAPGEDLLMPKEMHVPRTHRTDSIGYSCALWYSVDSVISRTVPFAQGSDPLFPPPDHGRSFFLVLKRLCFHCRTERNRESLT